MPDNSAWKRSLLTLKDEPFFDLVRNYLGRIQTPFHKPTIIDTLERFLLKPETRERIFLLLNQDEIAVAGFVLRAEGIDFDSLYGYFRDEYSPLRFRSLTDNLLERLIIFRDDEELFFINPLLARELEQIASPDPVESRPAEVSSAEPWFSEDLFLAFLSLIKEVSSFIRQDGELKKSIRTLLDERIPQAAIENRALLLLETAAALNLVREEGDGLVLLPDKLERFLELSFEERRRALIAGIAAGAWGTEGDSSSYRAGRLTVLSLIDNLLSDRIYRSEGLIRQITDGLAAEHRELNVLRLERAFERLINAGYLDRIDDFIRPNFQAVHNSTPEAPLILQPTFEILLTPDAGPLARQFCAVYCRLVRYDRVTRYELDHDLFLAPIRSQGAPDDLIERLQTVCGGTAPQNVVVTVKGWLEESRQIEITTGTVVRVADEMITIMEERFSDLILQTLAAGVYIVRPEKLSPLLTRWRSLGYAEPGEVRNLLTGSRPNHTLDYAPRLTVPEIPTRAGVESDGSRDDLKEKRNEVAEELQQQLDAQELTEEQRRELTAKIEKKIFLFPAQVGADACRIGRIEARGIDFHAKLRVIEDVLVSREDLLEIETPEADDGRVLVHPVALDKEPGNPTLKALVLPGEEERSFRVRKASRIRKRKRSLFY